MGVRLSTVGKWESINPAPGYESLARLAHFARKNDLVTLAEEFESLFTRQCVSNLDKETRIIVAGLPRWKKNTMPGYVLTVFDEADDDNLQSAVQFLRSAADHLEKWHHEAKGDK
jgi:transcriptional regulator with XRE-family HTH domain